MTTGRINQISIVYCVVCCFVVVLNAPKTRTHGCVWSNEHAALESGDSKEQTKAAETTARQSESFQVVVCVFLCFVVFLVVWVSPPCASERIGILKQGTLVLTSCW